MTSIKKFHKTTVAPLSFFECTIKSVQKKVKTDPELIQGPKISTNKTKNLKKSVLGLICKILPRDRLLDLKSSSSSSSSSSIFIIIIIIIITIIIIIADSPGSCVCHQWVHSRILLICVYPVKKSQ